MNHRRRLALRREETRKIVLTCLAGGTLVLQPFTDFGPFFLLPRGMCSPFLMCSCHAGWSNGQTASGSRSLQPGVVCWAEPDPSDPAGDSEGVPKAAIDLFICSGNSMEWVAPKETLCVVLGLSSSSSHNVCGVRRDVCSPRLLCCVVWCTAMSKLASRAGGK